MNAIYTISSGRRFTSYSFSSVTLLNDSSAATIIVSNPESVQLSGAPLAGYYTITCQDPNGIDWTTGDILYSADQASVELAITYAIPFLADKVDVLRTKKYAYVQNGIEYLLTFRDYLADPAQCTI